MSFLKLKTIGLFKRFNKVDKKKKQICLFFGIFLTISFIAIPFDSSNASNIAEDTIQFLFGMILDVMMWVSSLFIQMAIFLLRSFIEFAKYNGYVIAAPVTLGWEMVRDVANMFFVIILLVIAFGTILGIEQYEWRKTLVKLVIAAILINFSKLIAGIIIDFAHVFTMTFVNAISATAGGNFIEIFNLDKLLSMTGSEVTRNQLTGTSQTEIRSDLFLGMVIAMIFSTTAMVSIGVYTIMMIIRMVVLWVLIILSPLAYITSILPNTKKYSDEYWQEFIKYVIAAPMMVFFLWLAFATLGNVDTIIESGAFEQTGVDSQAVGISEAGSWHNMASFLIAVAFLLVGLEKVQQLGIKGGELTSHAKKAAAATALIASGYVVGRAAYERGVKPAAIATGKEGFRRVPLVGGAAMKERWSRLTENYRTHGVLGAVSGGYIKGTGGYVGKEKKAQATADLEKRAKDTDLTKWQRMKAGVGAVALRTVWEPAERKEARAENWKKSADDAKETMMKNFSTTNSASGQAKLEEKVRLEMQTKLSESKYDEKRQNLINEMMKYDKEIDSTEKDMLEAEARNQGKRVDEISDEDRAKIRERAVEAASSNLSIPNMERKYGKRYTNIVRRQTKRVMSDWKVGMKTRANVENISESMEEAEIREMASQRAAVYEKKGDNIRARAVLKNASAALQERKEKRYAGLNYSEVLAAMAQMSEELSGMTEGSEQYKEAVRQRAALQSVALAKDSETGVDSLRVAIKNSGFDKKEINDGNRLAAVLSGLLNENVENTEDGIRNAIENFRKNYDSDEDYNEAMRSLSNAFKASQIDGATAYAGLIAEGIDEEGNVIYDWGQGVGVKNKKGEALAADGSDRRYEQDTSEGNRDYYTTRVSTRTVTSVADMGSTDLDGNLTGFSDSQATSLAKFFKGKNANVLASMQAAFWDSFNDASTIVLDEDGNRDDTATQARVQTYVDAMRQVRAGLDDAAAGKFGKAAEQFLDKLDAEGANIKSQFI